MKLSLSNNAQIIYYLMIKLAYVITNKMLIVEVVQHQHQNLLWRQVLKNVQIQMDAIEARQTAQNFISVSQVVQSSSTAPKD